MGPENSNTPAPKTERPEQPATTSKGAGAELQETLSYLHSIVGELSKTLETLTPSQEVATPEMRVASRATELLRKVKAGSMDFLEKSPAIIGLFQNLVESNGYVSADVHFLAPPGELRLLSGAIRTLGLYTAAVNQGLPLNLDQKMAVESAAMTWVQIASRLVAAIPLEQSPGSTQHSFSWSANPADAGSVHRPFTLKAPTSTGGAPVGPGSGSGPPTGSPGPGAGPTSAGPGPRGVVGGPLIDLTLPRRP